MIRNNIFGNRFDGPWMWLLRLVPAFLIHGILLFVILPRFSGDILSIYGVRFADAYDKLALSLVNGHGYRLGENFAETMIREPGYPVFLAGVFTIFGESLEATRLANLLLAIGTVLVIVRMARIVSMDPGVPIVSSLLFLFHPGILIAEARGGVEMLFIFLLMIFLFTVMKAMETGRGRHYFVSGITLGGVLLTRGTAILFPFLLLLYLLITACTWKEMWHRFMNVCTLGFATALVISPWVIRNYSLVEEIVPTATVQGVAMQTGQYICKNLSFENNLWEVDSHAATERNAIAENLGYMFKKGYYQYFYRSKDELYFNKVLMERAMNEYFRDPVMWMRCASANSFNFWFAGKRW